MIMTMRVMMTYLNCDVLRNVLMSIETLMVNLNDKIDK